MCDVFTLTDRDVRTPEFANKFTARGKHDSAGRSLREFNLATRLFVYPCSYLLYSPAFTQLPREVRRPILGRLNDILSGKDMSPEFEHLSPAVRQDLTETLQNTMPQFKQLSQNR
ncbi:MAG: hypothetical protein VYA84_02185 [Planctomycetota bacterium]|nr:hypothetical protein [Planctomycetota bacterium]